MKLLPTMLCCLFFLLLFMKESKIKRYVSILHKLNTFDIETTSTSTHSDLNLIVLKIEYNSNSDSSR